MTSDINFLRKILDERDARIAELEADLGLTWEAHEQRGMSLRDWFAGQCDQPGVTELLDLAGKLPPNREDQHRVFAEWWFGMSNEERFSWYARCRYAMADAMLAERKRPEGDDQ